MPKPKQHQDKADKNRKFLESVKTTEHLEWAATAAFYTALHLIEKLFAYDNAHYTSHGTRSVGISLKHPKIVSSYVHLHNVAHLARYGTLESFRLSASDLQNQLIDVHLTSIVKYVEAEDGRRRSPPPTNATP